MKVRAILGSGSEVNLLAQSIFDKLIDSGAGIPTLRNISNTIRETI